MVLRIGKFALKIIDAMSVVAILAVAVACLSAPSTVLAQEIPPPKAIAADPNGVDLLSGGIAFPEAHNSIGPKDAGLAVSKVLQIGNLPISTAKSYTQVGFDGTRFHTTLVLDGRSQTFTGGSGTAGGTPDNDSTGSFVAGNLGTGTKYYARDGRVATFEYRKANANLEGYAWGYITQLDYPTGETLRFTRSGGMLKVESNFGYVLLGDWDGIDLAAGNLTQGNCAATTCAAEVQLFASQKALGREGVLSGSGGALTYTTAAGDGARSYVLQNSTLTDPNGTLRVTSATVNGATWAYSYAFTQTSIYPEATDGILQVTVTDPNGVKRIVSSRLSTGHVISDQEGVTTQDPSGRTTTYGYSLDATSNRGLGYGKIAKVTMPKGDWFEYTLDGYNNVTRRAHYPAGWTSGGGYTEMTAGYSCHAVSSLNTNICNQPDWIQDENGKQTDFTYDPVHGGVLTVTRPAGPSGVRPQTRYTYTQVQANYIKDGAMVGYPIWRLQSTSACRTQTSCAGTADETVTQYAYESGTSTPHNARLTSVTTRAGDNSVSSTTTFAYNIRGDVIETDGPLPGNVDLVQSRYDASRWPVGTVGPDPDGAGSLLYRASKTAYRADGQVQASYTGVVADRSDATFASALQVKKSLTNEYDAYARVSAQVAANGSGATYGLTETSYDAFGRVDCVAVRMDSAKFGSRLAACTPGSNSVGNEDRITRTTYDKYSQVTAVQSGYGVDPIFDRRTTYTVNGKVETEQDGVNNLTTYVYDNLDRLQIVKYPNTAKNTGSNSADYEQFDYDAVGNVTYRRLRDGRTITSSYDNLSRLRTRTVANADVTGVTYTYDYDNFDRPSSTTDAIRTVSQQYDALGRLTSEVGGVGELKYDYDAAGRRIKLTWPDAFFVTYDYDNASELTAIRRAGSTSDADKVAGFAYDDLGRRTAISRGNIAATTGYVYDPANLLLSNLTQSPTSAGDAVSFNFTYNPAGQVKTRTVTNAAYAWVPTSEPDRQYSIDGLNRITDSGTKPASGTTSPGYVTYGYDGRGNLKCIGSVADQAACTGPTTTYLYDAENRLRGAASGASLVYDPLGRLYQSTSQGGLVTRYLYDGANLIGEYAATGNVPLRRYVFGAGADEPLARYTNGGTTPEWLMADYQGSIIATLNSSGAVTGKNTYDEYGAPGAGNGGGLFQYTGQVYLADLDLYHYKARAYSPYLGRFLQTDPTGYDDGLNWYAYVGNDPLNRSDPTGLFGNDTSMCNSDFNVTGCSTIIGGGDEGGGGAPSPKSTATAAATGGAIGTGVGVAASAGCDAGTLGACVLANPAIVVGSAALGTAAGVAYDNARPALNQLGNAAQNTVDTLVVTARAHANSLSSPRPTWLYQLESRRSGDVLKYGITSAANPFNRYPAWMYVIGQFNMQPLAQYPNRASARAAEVGACSAYVATHGSLPPLSVMC